MPIVPMVTPCLKAMPPNRLQQGLETVPTHRLINDEFVLGERAVLEGFARLRRAQPPLVQKAAEDRAVNEKPEAPFCGERAHRSFGPTVEKRILDLMRDHGNTRVDQRAEPGSVEVGDPDMPDCPFAAEGVEMARHFDVAVHGVVPPMKLDQVERVAAQVVFAIDR
jgi:hypothetical protein